MARDSRVCVHDLPGRGWSDSAATPQDGARIATDLCTLLHRGHVLGPYVLAGHSFGGLCMMTFAARFPDEVAGMVLVDSTAPHWGTAPDGNGSSYNAMGRVSAMLSASVRLGLGRLVGQFSYDGLPPRARDEARASMATESQASSTVDEYAEANTSMSEAGSLTDFGAKPLVVLTAGLETGRAVDGGAGPDGQVVLEQPSPGGGRGHPRGAHRGREGRGRGQQGDSRRRRVGADLQAAALTGDGCGVLSPARAHGQAQATGSPSGDSAPLHGAPEVAPPSG